MAEGSLTTLPCDRAENKVIPKIHACGFASLLLSACIISASLPPFTQQRSTWVCVNPKYQATGVSFPQLYQCSGNKFLNEALVKRLSLNLAGPRSPSCGVPLSAIVLLWRLNGGVRGDADGFKFRAQNSPSWIRCSFSCHLRYITPTQNGHPSHFLSQGVLWCPLTLQSPITKTLKKIQIITGRTRSFRRFLCVWRWRGEEVE